MRPCNLFFAVVLAASLGGCTLGNWNSISREFDTAAGRSQLSDAKQRSILVATVAPRGQKDRRETVCAEPSPDVTAAYAAELSAQVQTAKLGVGLAGATQEGVASIGLRTQTIQLLRDAYYRICEAYLSGAIDAETYDIVLRRSLNNTIAFLAIEQLTGTVRAPAVVIGTEGTASPGTLVEGLIDRQSRLAGRNKEIDERVAAIDKSLADSATTDVQKKVLNEEKAGLGAEKERNTTKVKAYDKLLAQAQAGLVSGKTSGVIEALGEVDAAGRKEVAQTVERIVNAVVLHDYAGQVCFSYFREVANGHLVTLQDTTQAGKARSDLLDFCMKRLKGDLAGSAERQPITPTPVRRQGPRPQARQGTPTPPAPITRPAPVSPSPVTIQNVPRRTVPNL